MIKKEKPTERKRAAEALAYQAKLLANIHDAVIALDENFVITSWNRGAEELYGLKAEEAIGHTRKELLHTEYLGIDRGEAIRALRETGQFQGELTQRCREGRKIIVQARSVALKDDAGLRRLAVLVRDSNDAIMVQDFSGRILAWNLGAEKMYGYIDDAIVRHEVLEALEEPGV